MYDKIHHNKKPPLLLKGHIWEYNVSVRVYGLKIDTQTESCELSFVAVGVTMRTRVQDTASQMALRNCLPEVGVWQRSVYVWF